MRRTKPRARTASRSRSCIATCRRRTCSSESTASRACDLAPPSEIAEWVEWSATEALTEREARIAEFERGCASASTRVDSPSMLDVDLLLDDEKGGLPRPAARPPPKKSDTFPAVRD